MQSRSIVTALSLVAGTAGVGAVLAGVTSVASVATVACTTDTDGGGITPITGIAIRADSLVEGFGCGTMPGQIYKYAAVVTYSIDAGPACVDSGAVSEFVGLFDCYADGVFSNLPACSTGSQAFSLAVYAFDQAAYNAADDSGQLEVAAADNPVMFQQLVSSTATWTTTCAATQQSNVEVLAVCAPLTANPNAVAPTNDAAVDAPAGDDGASEAGLDAGLEASLDADEDAGADADDSDGADAADE